MRIMIGRRDLQLHVGSEPLRVGDCFSHSRSFIFGRGEVKVSIYKQKNPYTNLTYE
jgi:hypothetical protein